MAMTSNAPIRTSNRPKRLSMNPYGAMSKTLNVLREGPSTTAEVSATLGVSPRVASARLHDLLRRQKVTRTDHGVINGGRPGSLWTIAEGV